MVGSTPTDSSIVAQIDPQALPTPSRTEATLIVSPVIHGDPRRKEGDSDALHLHRCHHVNRSDPWCIVPALSLVSLPPCTAKPVSDASAAYTPKSAILGQPEGSVTHSCRRDRSDGVYGGGLPGSLESASFSGPLLRPESEGNGLQPSTGSDLRKLLRWPGLS